MKIYVAASWKNDHQPEVVAALREDQHEVYDFRHPKEGDNGFHWSEISVHYRDWTLRDYLKGLRHPLAQAGFNIDMNALKWADALLLVLPSGASSHLEAGWAVGARKMVLAYLTEQQKPELMYKMLNLVSDDLKEIRAWLGTQNHWTTVDIGIEGHWPLQFYGMELAHFDVSNADCVVWAVDRDPDAPDYAALLRGRDSPYRRARFWIESTASELVTQIRLDAGVELAHQVRRCLTALRPPLKLNDRRDMNEYAYNVERAKEEHKRR